MASPVDAPSSLSDPEGPAAGPARPAQLSAALGYGVSLVMVAAAGLVAFVVDHIVQAPNLSLIFVLPVIVAGLTLGWGPALASAVLSVAVFDFFFVEPRLTFQVASPTDLWALGLLLVVAAIASTVAAQSRRRALAARRAAEQAEALHALAQAIIKAEPTRTLLQIAAESLSRIFDAPAVIFVEQGAKLTQAAHSHGANPSAADRESAQWALANDQPTRAETYPFDRAEFDFWPIQTPQGRRLVLGVKLTGRAEGRPAVPDRHVELIAAYLAASAASAARGGTG